MAAQPQRKYKNEEQWEAMRQANPDLDERFIDSPIISSRPLYSYTNNEKNPPADSRAFRQKKTDESLSKRKLLAEAKQNAKQYSQLSPTVANINNNPYVNPPAYKAGLSTGHGLGKLKRKFSIPGNIARYVTYGSWGTLQFPLIIYGVSLLGVGSLGVGITAPIGKLLSALDINLMGLLITFIAPGLALFMTAVIFYLFTVFGVLIIFWVTGTKCLSGNKLSGKWLRFLAILILSLVPLLPWPIWWINYVATNPD